MTLQSRLNDFIVLVAADIKNLFATTSRTYAGTTATGIGTAAKTATISGYTPAAGDVLYLTVTNGSLTASSPTLNINGGGAKSILLGGSAANLSNVVLNAGAVLAMRYNGTAWDLFGLQSNYSATTQAEMEAGAVSTIRWISPLQVAQAIAALFGPPSTTTTALTAIGNAVNTANKRAGKMYYNTTTSKVVVAAGSTAGAVWNDTNGNLLHTPV